MAHTLIKGREIVVDTWQEAVSPAGLSAAAEVLVPLEHFLNAQDQWLAHPGALGVILEPKDNPEVVASVLSRLSVIAIRFPVFTDGRGYSTARLLRDKYHFTGEIRAVGDVFKDVLFYLSRVGFDAYQLRDGEDAEDALNAFETFSEAYQVSVERSSPLFRRRLEAQGG
jgi:uncharacterized protein (DUF934 family)